MKTIYVELTCEQIKTLLGALESSVVADRVLLEDYDPIEHCQYGPIDKIWERYDEQVSLMFHLAKKYHDHENDCSEMS